MAGMNMPVEYDDNPTNYKSNFCPSFSVYYDTQIPKILQAKSFDKTARPGQLAGAPKSALKVYSLSLKVYSLLHKFSQFCACFS